jgi:hypothetical protein
MEIRCVLKKKRIIIFFLSILAVIILSPQIQGKEIVFNGGTLKLELQAGFQGQKAPEGWLPLTVTIENGGNSNFQGELKIEILKRDIMSDTDRTQITAYKRGITIEKKRKKTFRTVILYANNFFATPHIIISKDKRVLLNKEIKLDLKIDYSSNILVINQSGSGYGFLKKDKKDQENQVFYLRPELMPKDWLAYREMDLVILGKSDFTDLSKNR